MPAFARHIGIDYSGAETPTASLKGLRVYLAEHDALQRRHSATRAGRQPPDPEQHVDRAGMALGGQCRFGSPDDALFEWLLVLPGHGCKNLVAETLPAMREGLRHHP